MSTHYILDDNNKKDVKFLKLVYDYCNENYLISSETKYVVVGHSVMEIKQALVNLTNYQLKFSDGKYRKHVTNKENNINLDSNTRNLILVRTPGYLPTLKDRNANINLSGYDNVITCCDNTWSPFMYKNNMERKDNLEENADVYLLSGRYLCGNPHELESLPVYNVKLSFGFFKDETLAKSVQDQINYISAGFKYTDIIDLKNILLKPRSLMSAYKKNYNILRNGVHTVKTVIKKYNEKYDDCKVKYEIEPSMFYVYVTSNDKLDIKKFTTFYNKLNLEYKLYVNSKQLQNMRQTIWTPEVSNGIFIRIS